MDSISIAKRDITGVILAGGRGRRLGGVDKGLVLWRGRPLVEYVIEALRPQVGRLMLNANRNRVVYASYGFPVIADAIGDHDGPLAGMLSAMRIAATPYLLAVPCDTPSPPPDLVGRLAKVVADVSAPAGVVFSNGRIQPVFALMRCTLADCLEQYMMAGGRGVGKWMHQMGAATVDFSDRAEAFENINTPEQLQRFQERPPAVAE